MGPGRSCRKGTGHAGHGSAESKEPLQVSKVITDIIRDTQALYGASHGKSSAAAQIFGPCRSLVTRLPSAISFEGSRHEIKLPLILPKS